MFAVLLFSAVLVILPIFLVQYQRFLAYLPPTDPHVELQSLLTGLQVSHRKESLSLDGAASDSASEGPSDPQPLRAKTTAGHERRESKKPWEPPFPTRSKTVRGPYLALPPVEEKDGDTRNEKRGNDGEKKLTSQTPLAKGEDALGMAHVPVTEPPSFSAPTLPTMGSAPLISQPQTTGQPAKEGLSSPTQSVADTPAAASRRGSFSLVQTLVLIFAFIIFAFAFAILVAHCMAWFVVYKTEARLGEARKGLLRGGEMRMCLCAR